MRVRKNSRRKRLAFDDHLHFAGIEHLAFQQSAGNAAQRRPVVFEDALGRVVALVDQPANFAVDLDCRIFTEVAMLRDLTAKEDLLILLAESDRTQSAHAELANHLASQLGSLLNVVAGAGSHRAQEQLLGQASAHHDCQPRLQIITRIGVFIVERQLHGYTERHAAGNDRHLVQRVGVLAERCHQGMARFVESRDPFLLVGENHRLALGAHEHLVLGQLKIVHQHRLAVLTGGVEGSLVYHIGQIGAGKTGCSTGQHGQIHVVVERNLAGMHAQDLLAAANVGTRHHHAAVEAAGAEQSRVQHVRPVGCRDQNDAFVGFEAVHFHQQLVQRLFALVVTSAETGAAVTADSVDFVDKNDAGSILLALLEQVADAACADTDEHLDEIGTGNAEERNVGFAGYGTRQQRLAGARRPYQQHAFRNTAAELLKFLSFTQKLDDFAQFFLGFVNPRHVLKRDLFLLHGEQTGLTLAEGQCFISARLHLPDHEDPQGGQQNDRGQIQQPGWPPSTAGILHRDVDALVAKNLDHVGIVRRHGGMERSLLVGILPTNVRPGKGDVLYLCLVYIVHELREVNFAFLNAVVASLDDLPQQDARQDNHQPEHDLFYGRIQSKLLRSGHTKTFVTYSLTSELDAYGTART